MNARSLSDQANARRVSLACPNTATNAYALSSIDGKRMWQGEDFRPAEAPMS